MRNIAKGHQRQSPHTVGAIWPAAEQQSCSKAIGRPDVLLFLNFPACHNFKRGGHLPSTCSYAPYANEQLIRAWLPPTGCEDRRRSANKRLTPLHGVTFFGTVFAWLVWACRHPESTASNDECHKQY